MQKYSTTLRDNDCEAATQAHNLPEKLIEPFAIDEENVAPPEKVRGRIIGRHSAVLHHYFVSDRRDVSGNGSHCRREGTRNDRDYSLQPGIATCIGTGKISDGIHRFDFHGDTGADFDGSVIPFRKSNAGDDAFEWKTLELSIGLKADGGDFLYGAAAGGVVFGGIAGGFAFREELQGSAELYFSADDGSGPSRDRRDAAGQWNSMRGFR